MTVMHKFKKYTFFAANMRMMCGEIEYTVHNYANSLSGAMLSASLDPHTKTACEKCWTPEEIKQINKAKERFPQKGYKPAKENTVNTYTITVNGIIEQRVQGTHTNTLEGRLNILNGDQTVAVFNGWSNYTVERDVDKQYVDKIINLEAAHSRFRAENTQLFGTVENNSKIIARLRREKSEIEALNRKISEDLKREKRDSREIMESIERLATYRDNAVKRAEKAEDKAAELRREKTVIEISQRNMAKEIQKLRRENTEYKRENYMEARARMPLTHEARERFLKEHNLLGYADTDSMHDACPGMIYFEKADVNYKCVLPEGHTESHRHIQAGIVWL